ncbi:MAG: glycosyltransferase, partial [Chthoniobacteraceae bacterium]
NARLAQFYRAANLFVHPGVQETFGLVALEAQACGKSVIGISGSYMDRIIHNDLTLWARQNSATALAAAITEASAIRAHHDPWALHNRIAERYSWFQVFRQQFELYREVIAHYRRP